MRASLCSSEPMLPTPLNNLGPEKTESRLPPQLNTAPQVPIHAPDTVMLEIPPVQKSSVAMSTPVQHSSREVEVPPSTVAISTLQRRSTQEIRAPECFSLG